MIEDGFVVHSFHGSVHTLCHKLLHRRGKLAARLEGGGASCPSAAVALGRGCNQTAVPLLLGATFRARMVPGGCGGGTYCAGAHLAASIPVSWRGKEIVFVLAGLPSHLGDDHDHYALVVLYEANVKSFGSYSKGRLAADT